MRTTRREAILGAGIVFGIVGGIIFVMLLLVGLAGQGPTSSLAHLVTIDNEVVSNAFESLNRQSSFRARFRLEGESTVEEWVVSYSHMHELPGRWTASGTMTDVVSGKHIVFDSTSSSTCLRQLLPEEGPWVIHEHSNWMKAENPRAFTPPVPMPWLRADPPLAWSSADRTDSELVLTSEYTFPDSGPSVPPSIAGQDGTIFLFIDPDTWLVEGGTSHFAGMGVSSSEDYDRYGLADVSGVHQSESDCKDRNP